MLRSLQEAAEKPQAAPPRGVQPLAGAGSGTAGLNGIGPVEKNREEQVTDP